MNGMQTDERYSLHKFSRDGHLERVQWVLNAGVSVNEMDSHCRTALHYACASGHVDIAQLLIQHGADLKICDRLNYSSSPLHIASVLGHQEVVDILLKDGADMYTTNNRDLTPIFAAVQNGKEGTVALLLKRGFPIIARNKDRTMLHYASANGHVNVAQLLIREGAELNAKDELGMTPLSLAAADGNVELLRILIDSGAGLDEKSMNNGFTSLHYAIIHKRMAVVEILLEKQVGVNEKPVNGYSALHLACELGNEEIVKTLLKFGANLEDRNVKNQTPIVISSKNHHVNIVTSLIYAGAKVVEGTDSRCLSYVFRDLCEKDDREMIIKLVDAGGNMNLKIFTLPFRMPLNQEFTTPLHMAVALQNCELARLLLQKGASVNSVDSYGSTPLHYTISPQPHLLVYWKQPYANSSRRCEITKCLLESGANINKTASIDGQTPLHRLCDAGDLESVKILLENGAEVNICDKNGDSALHIARGEKSDEIVKALLARGALPHKWNVQFRTPLHMHCVRGHLETVRLILDVSGYLNLQDKDRNTPLHVANGPDEIVQLLCKKGASVGVKNSKGYTPLHMFCIRRKLNHVKILLSMGASVNEIDCEYMLPLHHACAGNSSEICRVLLQSGASINAKDNYGRTPMDVVYSRLPVSNSGKPEASLLEVLVEFGADVNQKNSLSETTLHRACHFGDVDAVQILLNLGANVEETDAGFLTPIQITGESILNLIPNPSNDAHNIAKKMHNCGLNITDGKHFKVLEVLLQAGANINATYKEGRTLFHLACEKSAVELVKFLIEKGLDVNETDAKGKSPLQFLKIGGVHLTRLMKILLGAGAYVNAQDSQGNTMLHSRLLSEDHLKILVDAGANVSLKNKQNKVPLLIHSHDYFKTRFLLDAGTDVQDLNIFGSHLVNFGVQTLSLLLDYGLGNVICRCERCMCNGTVMMCAYEVIQEKHTYSNTEFLEHTIKVEVAGLRTRGMDVVSKPRGLESSFREQCEEELRRMKCNTIGDSCITYFDFIKCRNLSSLCDQIHTGSLSSTCCCGKFPIYGDIIGRRCRDFNEILLRGYCNSFFELTDLPYLPLECADMILKNLPYGDLRNVAKVCGSRRFHPSACNDEDAASPEHNPESPNSKCASPLCSPTSPSYNASSSLFNQIDFCCPASSFCIPPCTHLPCPLFSTKRRSPSCCPTSPSDAPISPSYSATSPTYSPTSPMFYLRSYSYETPPLYFSHS